MYECCRRSIYFFRGVFAPLGESMRRRGPTCRPCFLPRPTSTCTSAFHHRQRDAHRARRAYSTGVPVKYITRPSRPSLPFRIRRAERTTTDYLTPTFRREIPVIPRESNTRCRNTQSPWRASGLRISSRTPSSSGAVRADPRPFLYPPPHTPLARSPRLGHMYLTAFIWSSEIEDMLRMPAEPTLDMLDTALNRFITFCASYHGV
jgi:hypothetical protein